LGVKKSVQKMTQKGVKKIEQKGVQKKGEFAELFVTLKW